MSSSITVLHFHCSPEFLFSFLVFSPALYYVFPSSAVVLRAPSQVDLRRALESAWQRCMGYPELQAALQPRAGWKNTQPRMVLCQKVSALWLGEAQAEGFTETALSSMRMLMEVKAMSKR